MGDRFGTAVTGRKHAANALHRAQASAAHSLFSRVHSSRYFGGMWFKLFTERGPC